MAEISSTALIEKIVRAKIHLEKLQNLEHRKGCVWASDDMDATGPCTCGITDIKNIAFAATQELKLS